ncbi:LOW QUALITY PROTEIN: rho guanine nucleotide exchange factor 18a [Labeo rohita]|uniref:LOW QUALITY PROTEIN: rho guanine nucleotide exchange factor 18a n=1 Tax=Labeo rohita TaxID=84645 RepID=UPI0021E1D6D0|nr:LOW QUALITY PROTEIN: rho guanine nucleotide exchange factor 18a [Labeo rohita]
MDEIDSVRFKPLPEDSNVPLTYPADTINIDDGRYNTLREDLEADARDFEAPTWSLAVDQQYLKDYSKEDIKRQDVIHELIQTEINHVRTLKLVLGVYVRELRENLQMDETQLERLFPQVENLLQVHQLFLDRLKQRRIDSLEPGSTQNYCIHNIGDILIAQFSGEIRDRLQYCYGVFCSHHTDAVNFYKDLMQNNKKFQNLIRKICQLSIMRRLGIPEIILLITQRITKYPVLYERVIKYTEVDSEEHRDLVRGLELLKDTISQVNSQVDKSEKAVRLRDLSSRLEPKSQVRTTQGRVFRREDMLQGQRKLLHEGALNWRITSNKTKDVLVLLLSDVLLLLLEKDQRLTFASLDGKPAVISLQKLIIRDVAHDEKALFLISASSETPEMYEFHTSSGEERKTWRDQIWKAVEHCPEEEDEPEKLPERIQDYQRYLCMRDALIEQLLLDKLKLFSSISAYVTGVNDISPSERRLLRGNAAEPMQGERLLAGALKDVEILQTLLVTCEPGQTPSSGEGMDLVPLSKRPDAFTGFNSDNACMLPGNGIGSLIERMRDRSQWANLDPQLRELYSDENLELSADEEITPQSWNAFPLVFLPKAELYHTVTNLSQKLYSLQSVVQQLESHIVVQRATIEELMARPRGNTLLEKEKHRNLEKQREEMAHFQRLQNQHRQEQMQWEQERERQRVQAEVKEKVLKEKELGCYKLEKKLEEEKQELARCKAEYQEDLERLRDAMRTVEKERERLEKDREKLEQLEKKFKKNENVPNIATFPMEKELTQIPPPYPLLKVVNPGFDERPPLVPPRRESIANLSVKPEVPIHLISTTNQSQKAGSVQQTIPTKLAAHPKSKDKHSKQKSSHQRTKSAAGIEVSQILPIKVTGKEGGSLRAMRSNSPHQLRPDMFIPPEKLSGSVPSNSGNGIRKRNHSHNHNTLSTQPVHPKAKDKTTAEDILFF